MGAAVQEGRRVGAAVAPKRFPAEWEGAVTDAAAAWSRPGTSFLSTEKASTVDLRETPNGSIGGSIHGIGGISAGVLSSANVDGGMMPFDMEHMDVPVAYSMTNAGIAGGIPNAATINDLASPSAISAGGSGEDKDQIDRDAVNAAAIMENIDQSRIPCPRLCGATFSSGVGGLAGEYLRQKHVFVIRQVAFQ